MTTASKDVFKSLQDKVEGATVEVWLRDWPSFTIKNGGRKDQNKAPDNDVVQWVIAIKDRY